MIDLSRIQAERNAWVRRNFTHDAPYHSILGAMEELGELAHHYLKRDQGIRGDEAFHTAEIRDAVADCVIFLMGVASHEGFDLGEVIEETWARVKMRNWASHPQTAAGDSND